MKKIAGTIILLTSMASFSAYAADPASNEAAAQTQSNNVSSSSDKITLGSFYQGGVIYWLDPEKSYKHGLIADINDAPNSLKAGYSWDTNPPSKTNATNDNDYAGKIDTTTIIKAIGTTRAQAANACATSTNQGYSDWYLPSMQELSHLFEMKTTIEKAAKAESGQTLGNSPYWSATEYHLNSAWTVSSMGGSFHANTTNKRHTLSVRCVRAF